MSSPRRQFARNPVRVNGLDPLTRISTASVQASTASFQASNASVRASTASFRTRSGTDKASGRSFGASSVTDRASSVAFEFPRHPFWSRFASDQASTASVQAPSASVKASSAALGAPIHAPERLWSCPQALSRPPAVTAAIPGSAPGEGDPVKPAPWSADNGLAATNSRLRSVDISHLSMDISHLSIDHGRMPGATGECPGTTDECPGTSP